MCLSPIDETADLGFDYFNADDFLFDILSVQNAIYVAVPEMTHCFGFSYLLYDYFPTGNSIKTSLVEATL